MNRFFILSVAMGIAGSLALCDSAVAQGKGRGIGQQVSQAARSGIHGPQLKDYIQQLNAARGVGQPGGGTGGPGGGARGGKPAGVAEREPMGGGKGKPAGVGGGGKPAGVGERALMRGGKGKPAGARGGGGAGKGKR